MDSSSRQGLVLRIDAKVCHVEVDGQRHVLPLRGRLFERHRASRRPLAVGDLVVVRFGADGGAIEELLPRISELHRRASTEGEARMQVLAANITLVVAVASAEDPPFQPLLVDGVLAAAAREGIDSALAITKVDLSADGAETWARVYAGAGCRVFRTSTEPGRRTDQSLSELAALLHENRSVLCGPSGAGKSTLLNALVPGLGLEVGGLNHIGQGRHTTTRTELFPLPGGGHVLDTPGIRSFHLFHVGSQELSFYFPEIDAVRGSCRFSGCLHRAEPGCAVRAAAQSGRIPKSRFASYAVMLEAALEAEEPSAPTRRSGGAGKRRPTPP
ncbi:MAG: ribosome small subunit-dependent GTPase A [Planctomycetota bacterium]